MIRTILVAALALAAISFSRHAEASAAPWCAVYSTDQQGVYWDCQYHSSDECRPNALANRGRAHTTSAGPARSTGSPKNIALAHTKNQSAHILTMALHRSVAKADTMQTAKSFGGVSLILN